MLASFGVKISGSHADRLASFLRTGTPAVQARVTDDSLLLDLRTVGEDELETLVTRLRDSLAAAAQDSSR